ncbi:hypothetical protein GQ55_1G010900 [Panicum hallii var. hallii]|uniref:Uncharacterized protein n=1 Tax=Panicum hallii var. hallii TaxID=1504633 RepID=A0A2T7F0W6_9POAL|nr:hypothetical protein GQ55_1G010900 [Panicum hallii var. hallii]
MATSSSPLAALHSSSFTSSTPSLPCKLAAQPRRRRPYTRIRAIDLDQNTIVAISVGVVSIAVGIGVPVFYETQIDNASKRENTQPCFPCSGSGARFALERALLLSYLAQARLKNQSVSTATASAL